jgi:hypothetical protein
LNTMQPVLMSGADQEQIRKGGGTLKTLVHMDGHEHYGYRAVTNDWFKPNAIRRRMEARLSELSRKFVDQMIELGGECGFATDIARFYSLQVIMSILGVPEEDEPLMLRLTPNLHSGDDPELRVGEARAESMNLGVKQFVDYFMEVTAARQADPAADLASTMANGRIDERLLDELETFGYYVIVATAEHDTTSSSLAGGLRALINYPGQLRLLQGNPKLIDNAFCQSRRDSFSESFRFSGKTARTRISISLLVSEFISVWLIWRRWNCELFSVSFCPGSKRSSLRGTSMTSLARSSAERRGCRFATGSTPMLDPDLAREASHSGNIFGECVRPSRVKIAVIFNISHMHARVPE